MPFHIGQTASINKTITDADIRQFAELSLDNNPLHLDDEAASQTRFGQRIAHGMLSASLISAVIGTKLPGFGAVYLNQTLSFRRPVLIGDTVTATAEIMAIRPDKPIATLKTLVTNQNDEVVIEGEAVVLLPT